MSLSGHLPDPVIGKVRTPTRGIRVLVVDDNPIVLQMVAKMTQC